MRRPRAPELLLATGSLVVFFGLAEGALRIAGFGPEPPLPGPMYVRSATRGYDLMPGYRGAGERSPYLDHPPIAVNALGFRGEEVAAARRPGTIRILCLGDSYMFGWGVEDRATFPARLQARLEARRAGEPGGVEAINAGVPAYTTAQELDLLVEKGPGLRPDVVVLGFVLNDALPGGDRRRRLPIPFKAVLRHSAVYRFAGRLYQQGMLSAIAEASTGEDRARDILAYERANTEALESGRPEFERARAEAARDAGLMAEASRRLGARFLLMIYPNRHQIEDAAYTRALFNEALRGALEARGIEVLDLFAPFKTESRGARLFLADTHPNARGHDLAARAAAERIDAKEQTR